MLRNSKTPFLLTFVTLLSLGSNVRAWEPNNKDLGTAIETGDFATYFTNISTWLNQKAPADPSGVSEATLKDLLKDPDVANLLDQRTLIAKLGVAKLGTFAKADPSNQKFLAWLLQNTQAMDLYLEGATPTGLSAREANNFTLNTASLNIWKTLFFADPESKEGIYLRLAIATAIAPPGTGNRGAGMTKTPGTPWDRYTHFKTAHKNKELFPSFDDLSVWEYTKIVSSCASDADLAWAREMINSWRPDLRIKEQVVNSTSEVWRRNSPHPYIDYKAVLSGGGKCGPRSSWSVMICQAFGIPAIGVGQPQHACVAYKVADPSVEPQPGSAWKVGYGRGWHVSRLEGMSGTEFLAGAEQRGRAAQFSLVEHLRRLASTLVSKEQAAAVKAVAHNIQHSVAEVKTDLTASAKAAEAEKELQPEVKAGKATTAAQGPFKVSPSGTRIEAVAFSGMSGVSVLDCYTGGKQVNFQKSVKDSWVEYALDVPAAGVYALVFRVATPNLGQVFDIHSGSDKPTVLEIPNTTGVWATTQPVEIKLEQGKQTLKISAPFQRGVAVKWLELKAK
ncbi:MAG: carbohydrate-binding protein [Planctomycetota bacterium]